jgi:NADH-quinone oxidoreductase subunit G
MVTLTIDDRQVTVPVGTVVVDAAKKAGIDIPVFCYHPKMEPVGMCRMCLVEIGRPLIDRATGQVALNEDGTPKIQYGPKLETGCTVPVSEGMVVRTQTQQVEEARKGVLEFLLTSHPLDCPICDKGGECPLQNLTMGYGPGESRFRFEDKKRLAKRVPLGELIVLDRERCIQCARCVRFQDLVVDDPVIGFYNRGRSLEIVTYSEPGFDSIFSGNTTDICPVGALTTADFRFGARPWELTPSASICPHCPVGCNLTLNVRREDKAGGVSVIKRILPRQNELVNEIWICDKGRFSYHFTESRERLEHPLVRRNGELVSASWDEALDLVAAKIKEANTLVALAGGRLSNEDLFNLRELTAAKNGKALLYADMAGGDLTARYGLPPGSNFAEMGKGSAILVIASDLHQEAPLWWLRVKQAAQRGAALIVANPRATRLDSYAAHAVRYSYGEETAVLAAFLPDTRPPRDLQAAAAAFAAAENRVILFGGEGLGLAGSRAVAQTAAAVLAGFGRVDAPNNGMVGVWQRANDQGAWETGFRPADDLAAELSSAGVLLIAAADPAGDDPALAEAVSQAGFVVVQELFLSETARRADVVLPAQAWVEREGSLTSGERRVQRYYPALPPRGESRPDYAITAQIGQRLGLDLEGRAASLVFLRMAAGLETFAGLSYQRLSETGEQWPIIGRADVYYGGTAYDNHQGLGSPLALAGEGEAPAPAAPAKPKARKKGDLLLVPVTRLYDRGATLLPTRLLSQRMAERQVWLHPRTAAELGLEDAGQVEIHLSTGIVAAGLRLDETVPLGVGLVPRSVGIPLFAPQAAALVQPALAAEA